MFLQWENKHATATNVDKGALKNHSITQICSVNNSSAMRSYYFGTKPKQRNGERNMATRHKNSFAHRLLLGLTLKALRPTKLQGKSWKSLPGLLRKHSELYFLQIRRRRTYLLSTKSLRMSSLPPFSVWIATKWNLQQSYVAHSLAVLTNHRQAAKPAANHQRAAKAFTLVARLMTSITGPPLLLRFPLLELGFFRREVTKYRKQNDPIWTRRLAFRRQCIVGDCPVTNEENVLKTWRCLLHYVMPTPRSNKVNKFTCTKALMDVLPVRPTLGHV